MRVPAWREDGVYLLSLKAYMCVLSPEAYMRVLSRTDSWVFAAGVFLDDTHLPYAYALSTRTPTG